MPDDVHPCGKPVKRKRRCAINAIEALVVVAVLAAVVYAGFKIATSVGPIDVPGKRIRVVHE